VSGFGEKAVFLQVSLEIVNQLPAAKTKYGKKKTKYVLMPPCVLCNKINILFGCLEFKIVLNRAI
jgi:hypothetical protein